jgi:hypothetical protein
MIEEQNRSSHPEHVIRSESANIRQRECRQRQEIARGIWIIGDRNRFQSFRSLGEAL